MPRHYAIDANVVKGTIVLNNSKKGKAYFKDSNGNQVAFSKRPFISLTLSDQSSVPPYKSKWIKQNGMYVGIEIRFKNKYTGEVDWEVKE